MHVKMSEYDRKMKHAQAHIKRIRNYDVNNEPYFDMRAYAKYLEENNIPRDEVTKEIMKMFSEEGASK